MKPSKAIRAPVLLLKLSCPRWARQLRIQDAEPEARVRDGRLNKNCLASVGGVPGHFERLGDDRDRICIGWLPIRMSLTCLELSPVPSDWIGSEVTPGV